MSESNPFHCCASCVHFRVEKGSGRTTYRCSRLTYETRPDYRFDCWTPSENVQKLMNRRTRDTSER
ncbi:hypothetical protein ACAF76_014055 [Brevibacillus sp. TJ4]|uniref:hypothetical protein n=1 Tax=Brevibacillus sp. TJ4 TaxID=3234853 RepID=UPI0037D3E307